MLIEQLLDGEADELGRKAIELAKAGDITALRLWWDRIVPPRRDRYIDFPLPPLKEAADAAKRVVRDCDGSVEWRADAVRGGGVDQAC